ALRRMLAALRPGGVLLDEEPDFVTIYEAAEPPALRRVMRAAMAHLERTCPVDCEYGRRLLADVSAAGFLDAAAEGRCPVVRGGTPPAAHFLRLTLDKLEPALLADRTATAAEYAEPVAVLNDPSRTIVMPMTLAAWGWRECERLAGRRGWVESLQASGGEVRCRGSPDLFAAHPRSTIRMRSGRCSSATVLTAPSLSTFRGRREKRPALTFAPRGRWVVS